MLTMIAAVTRDNALGRDGDMIFHISADLKRFKSLTMGHPLIMGRRTFESFPNGPLPGRRNIVITRSSDFSHEGAESFASLESALSAAGDDAMVIGGGMVYAQAMPLADRLEITEIDALSDGADTFFPAIDPKEWKKESESEWMDDARSGIRFRYVTYIRTIKR